MRYLSPNLFISDRASIRDNVARGELIHLYSFIKSVVLSCSCASGSSTEVPENIFLPKNLFSTASSNNLDLYKIVAEVMVDSFDCSPTVVRSIPLREVKDLYIPRRLTIQPLDEIDQLPNYFKFNTLICDASDAIGCCADPPSFELAVNGENVEPTVTNLSPVCSGVFDFDIEVTAASGGPVLYSTTYTQATLPSQIAFSTFSLGPGIYTFSATLDETACGGNTYTTSINLTIPSKSTAVDDTFAVAYNAASAIYDASTNDTACTYGTTTYVEIDPISPSGPTASLNTSNGQITFQPNINNTGDFTMKVGIECDGILSSTSTITFSVASPTASAVDDSFGPFAKDTVQNVVVSGNDTGCSSGTISYGLIGGQFGGTTTVVNSTTGEFQFTPSSSFVGDGLFIYGIYCDTILVSTATVTLTYETPIATAVNDTEIDQIKNSVVITDLTTNDTACNLSATTTYEKVLNSEVGGSVSITTGGIATFTPTTDYLGSISYSYNVLCNGEVIDTAIVSFNYIDNTIVLESISGGTGSGDGVIDTTGTQGSYVKALLDKGNTGATDYDSGYAVNTSTNTFTSTGFEIVDGDKVSVCVATDNVGTNESCIECVIPNSSTTAFSSGGHADLNNISIDLAGTWPVSLTTYQYLIDYKDEDGNVVYSETVQAGTTSFNNSINLTQQGVSKLATVEVTAYEGSCAEQDLSVLDRCALISFGAVSADQVQSYFDNGNGTHSFTLGAQVILTPLLASTVGSTLLTLDASGSIGPFIKGIIKRNGLAIYDSGYVTNTGSNTFNSSPTVTQNGDTIEIVVANSTSGTDATTYEWIIPNVTNVSVADTTLTTFTYTVTSTFDTKAVNRTYQVEYYDSSNSLGYSHTISSPASDYVVDLDAQGMASIGSLRIKAVDSKVEQATQFIKTIDVCVNTDERDDLLTAFTPSQADDYIAARYGTDTIPELSASDFANLFSGGVGSTFRDPAFGNLVKVVQNGVGSINSERNQFNADDSLAFFNKSSGVWSIHDGLEGDVLYTRDFRYQGINPTDSVRWHPTNPQLVFFIIGNQIIFHNVVTNTQSVFATSPFGQLGTGNRRLAGGDGNDDKGNYMLLSHGKQEKLQVINLVTGNIVKDVLVNNNGVFSWEKQEEPWDANSTNWDYPGNVPDPDFDYATLSHSGEFIVTAVKGQGSRLWDFNGNFLGQLTTNAGHQSKGFYNVNGVLKDCSIMKVVPGMVSAFPGSRAGDMVAIIWEVITNPANGVRSLVTDYRIILHWEGTNQTGGGNYSQSTSKNTSLVALNPWEQYTLTQDAYYGEIVETSLTDDDVTPRRIIQHMIDDDSVVGKQPEAWINSTGTRMFYKSNIKQQLSNNGYIFFIKLYERTCIQNR